MLLNCDRNRMNGPRLLPSGKRLGPYFCRRFAASREARPFPMSVARRFTTSSTATACQVIPSAVESAFAVALIGVFRQAGSLVAATAHPATKARSPPYCYGEIEH